MSEVTFTLLTAAGERATWTEELEEKPGLDAIRRALAPAFPARDFEHVTVLHDGEVTDLFVDEIGQIKGLPRNEEATRIYRNNWMTQHPDQDPESLPDIVGPAVLVSRRIWL